MKIKAIALDLDGTLLDDNKKISQMNYDIIKDLARKGIKIYLATGRPYLSAKKFADELGIDGVIITYNGARVVDYKKDSIMYDMPLQAHTEQGS